MHETLANDKYHRKVCPECSQKARWETIECQYNPCFENDDI